MLKHNRIVFIIDINKNIFKDIPVSETVQHWLCQRHGHGFKCLKCHVHDI